MKTTRRTISRHISLPKKPRTVEIPADLAYINHPESRESNARPMTQFIQSDQMHSPKSFTPQRRDLNSMQEPSSNHTPMQRTNPSNMPIYVVVHAGSIFQATTKSILRRTYRIYFLSIIAFFSFNYGKNLHRFPTAPPPPWWPLLISWIGAFPLLGRGDVGGVALGVYLLESSNDLCLNAASFFGKRWDEMRWEKGVITFLAIMAVHSYQFRFLYRLNGSRWRSYRTDSSIQWHPGLQESRHYLHTWSLLTQDRYR